MELNFFDKYKVYLAKIVFGLFIIKKILSYYFMRFYKFLLIAVVLLLFLLAYRYYFPEFNSELIDFKNTRIVHIPRGASLKSIAAILTEKSILKNENVFILLGKISGYGNDLKAGYLIIPENLPPWHLLNYLKNPREATTKVTIPEGISSAQIAEILQREMQVDSAKFMLLVNDSSFCDSLGVPSKNLNGYLLPETYFFSLNMPVRDLLKELVGNSMQIFKSESVRSQLKILEMSIPEIVTLASIIEGEVMVDSERVLVSSVYHNRLEKGWLLQADPTIQYIIKGTPRRLYNKDLEIDSPYNTYKYPGLPPGPINNPGKKSILAAIFPAETEFMYFVATGDGGHNFALTAAEHAKYKAEFDKVRKRVRRFRLNSADNN